jgi:hypothetical protein
MLVLFGDDEEGSSGMTPGRPSRRRLFGLVCLIAALLAASAVFGSAVFARTPRRVEAPSTVAVAYIAAIDRHDGSAVCRLFAPQLRAFEIEWDAPAVGPRSCAHTVAGHFDQYYSRHRWASARIRGPVQTTVDSRTGIAAVHMVLVHHYVCSRQSDPPEPCHPGNYVRPDIIYLIKLDGRWHIIKPGAVYRSSEVDQPDGTESDYYPPGTTATIAGPVNLPAPTVLCPSSAVTSVSPPHVLQSTYEPNPRGEPGAAPWLQINALSIARLSSDTICFTLTLAGPPRPDSGYEIFFGTVQEQAAALLFQVEIDGLGEPHSLLEFAGALSTLGLAPYLPAVFLAGDQLEIIGTDPMFAKLQQFLVQAQSESIQDDEPLLRRPLDAGDTAPQLGCLTFPTGTLNKQGLCGETAAG